MRNCPFCDAEESQLYTDEIADCGERGALSATICGCCGANGPLVPGGEKAALDAWEFHGASGAAFFSGGRLQ